LFPKERSIVEKLQERSKILPPSSENAETKRGRIDFPPGELLPDVQPQSGETTPKKRVQLIPWADLRDEPVRWLVEDLLPANSFSAIFGRPGAYKSFASLGMAAAIATGSEFLGRATSQGSVLYIAAEGSAGLRRRRDAIIRHHNLPAELPIWFVKAQLNLATTTEDLDLLLAEIDAIGQKFALIVVDTWARVTNTAEENSASEMGAAIAICGEMQARTGAAVLIVHHSSKGSEQMRGSSAILAAVDAELYCEKLSAEGSADRQGVLKITKMKDGLDDVSIPFRAVTVQLSPIDETQTSLAIELIPEAEAAAIRRPSRIKLGKNAKVGLEALRAAIAEGGVTPPIGDRAPHGVKAVSKELWRLYFTKMSTHDGGTMRTAWARVPDQLKDAGLINNWGEDWYWIVKEPETMTPPAQKVQPLATYDDIPFP
jgi:putative DNA primase/helicase